LKERLWGCIAILYMKRKGESDERSEGERGNPQSEFFKGLYVLEAARRGRETGAMA